MWRPLPCHGSRTSGDHRVLCVDVPTLTPRVRSTIVVVRTSLYEIIRWRVCDFTVSDFTIVSRFNFVDKCLVTDVRYTPTRVKKGWVGGSGRRFVRTPVDGGRRLCGSCLLQIYVDRFGRCYRTVLPPVVWFCLWLSVCLSVPVLRSDGSSGVRSESRRSPTSGPTTPGTAGRPRHSRSVVSTTRTLSPRTRRTSIGGSGHPLTKVSRGLPSHPPS